MQKKLKEMIAGVIGLSIFMIPMVFASSYSTWYLFTSITQGATRAFNGQNIEFISHNPTSSGGSPTDNVYKVTLYRDVLGPDDKIGEVILPRNQYGRAYWSNVGSGNYYVVLKKATDYVTLEDDNVTFANY